jgi:hypothetical protein
VWLDALRIAKEHGTLDDLLPPGVNGLLDCPYTVFDAIRLGHIFLSFDELSADERPPKRIWLDGDALREWFEDVRRKREAKYGGKSDGGWDKSIEDPVQNQAAKDLIVGG